MFVYVLIRTNYKAVGQEKRCILYSTYMYKNSTLFTVQCIVDEKSLSSKYSIDHGEIYL